MSEAFSAQRPRKGDRGSYRRWSGKETGFTVHSVDGNLCYVVYDDHPTDKAEPFIWRFSDGLNALHDWPGKAEAA